MATLVSESLISAVDAPPPGADPDLYSDFQKLRFVSQSNFAVNYWQNVANSFRMHVFPYADIFLSQDPQLEGEHDMLVLPMDVNDLPTLVDEITRQTADLKTKLATLRTTIAPEVHKDQHIGSFPLAQQFYVWKGDNLTTDILRDFLSGEFDFRCETKQFRTF